MSITRRKFLLLSGSLAISSFDRTSRSQLARVQLPKANGCVILDLEERCSLPESLQGYRECLAELGFSPVTITVETLTERLLSYRHLIIPAAVSINESLASRLLRFLENGGSILLELGLAFVEPVLRDTQCWLFRSQLGFSIQPAVWLWPRAEARGCTPYVDYVWPLATKVRDFSRVVPLSARGSEVIAQVHGVTVGLRRRVGKGALTVLGSPLGPVLRAGDLQAQSWLDAVMSTPVGIGSKCAPVTPHPASWKLIKLPPLSHNGRGS